MTTSATLTYCVIRTATLLNGKAYSAVEATGFASKRDAQVWLGLAEYFPVTRDNERVGSVRYIIIQDEQSSL